MSDGFVVPAKAGKSADVIDLMSLLRKSVEGGKKAPAKPSREKQAAANDDEKEEKPKPKRARKRRAA